MPLGYEDVSSTFHLAIMAESYFTRVANDILKVVEQISDDVDEMFATVFSGGSESPKAPPTSSPEIDDILDDMPEDFEHPLKGIADSVMDDILAGQKRPEGILENITAFRHAVRWTEPFVMSIVAFQIIMFVLCLLVTQKNVRLAPRLVYMIAVFAFVRSAEYLNDYGRANWEQIATQNYFDQQGIFVSVMISAPLLLDSLIMLFIYLREASQLLVVVKRRQIAQQQKKRGKQDKESKKTK